MPKRQFGYDFPIGKLYVTADEDFVLSVSAVKSEIKFEATPLIKKAKTQLDEYFLGKRKVFDLPLNFVGTDFRKRVWKVLCEIPYGETRTYKQVAALVGNEKACRAVGMANNKNPLLIVVPCHRVVGADGSLVGYAGGLSMKQSLLELEKSYFK